MQTKTIGFFTEESAQLWFWNNGDKVEKVCEKQIPSKGDASPTYFVKMVIPDHLINKIYPDGVVSEQDIEEIS